MVVHALYDRPPAAVPLAPVSPLTPGAGAGASAAGARTATAGRTAAAATAAAWGGCLKESLVEDV